MSIFLQRQIDELRKQVVAIGTLCEENVRSAVTAVLTRDVELAGRVIASDKQIDLAEVDLEEECLHTLALNQPVAHDLRYVVAILKINNDLERIGDHAKNIAQQALVLADAPELERMPYDLRAMAGYTTDMLGEALDALVELDVAKARAVRKLDDAVDAINAEMYESSIRLMRQDPMHIDTLVTLMSVSKQLERIADHAWNIAKDVVYMVEGEILRHARTRRARQQQQSATASDD